METARQDLIHKHKVILIVLILLAVCNCTFVFAHCDTMDGPVVADARKAIEQNNVNYVLKWVHPDNEKEIKDAFDLIMKVRELTPEARELSDMYFFETLVRIHRASEGAPYIGLSAGPVEPIIAEADNALEKGSVDHLVRHVTDAVAKGIRQRFNNTLEKKKHAEESISFGREFVEAYVEFTHYVERLHLDAAGKAAHAGKPAVHKH